MPEEVPGLSYAIRQALNFLSWQQGVYSNEFKTRLQLAMGHPNYYLDTAYGIVDELDPVGVVAGGARPLTVSANVTDQSSVDITPGMVVTKTGLWTYLNDYVRGIALAATGFNIANVVYLQYTLADGAVEVNEKQQPVVILQGRPQDAMVYAEESLLVGVSTVEGYLSLSTDVRDETVPLCVVTLQEIVDPISGARTTQLSFDHTRDQYVWNRPWFSMVDVEHRNKQGSGTPADDNPHALTQNNLSIGNFTPIQTQIDHGMIIGEDQTVPKVPGYRCEVSIPSTDVELDATGALTGWVSKQYMKLPHFPVRLGRVWWEATGEDIPSVLVPETNIVVFPHNGIIGIDNIHFYYTRVEGCEPPIPENQASFQTNNPTNNELVVAGGREHTALVTTEEPFADASQYPMRYILFVDGEGNLRKTPQVIYCLKKLTDISTTDDTEIDQYGPAPIAIGLINATDPPPPTMSLKVRIFGKDTNGSDINELFHFFGGDWDPTPVPSSYVVTNGLLSSTQLFASVSSLQLEEEISLGPNAAIQLWALQNPFDTPEKMSDAALISEVMWDGLRLADIRDQRVLFTSLRDFLIQDGARVAFEQYVRSHAPATNNFYIEDLRAPRYHILGQPREYLTSGSDFTKRAPWLLTDKFRMQHRGFYKSRALYSDSGAGIVYRMITTPVAPGNVTTERPRMRFWQTGGPSWGGYMVGSAVPGLRGHFEWNVGYVAGAVQVRFDPPLDYDMTFWAIYS